MKVRHPKMLLGYELTYLSSYTVLRRRETHKLGNLRLLLRRVRGRHPETIQFVLFSN